MIARVAIRWQALSGGNIGGQPVFDLGNQVFQAQLAFFQPLQRQLIPGAFVDQRLNGVVQISMLAAKNLELDTQDIVILHRQIGGRIHRFG